MKILIAEDDTFFQKFYKTELTQRGYEVEVAVDGEEAIQKLQDFKPNLVLLDIIMPKKDGFDVLEEIKQSSAHPTVIVFSTLGQESDVKKAMDLGAKDYINKSYFDLDTLIEKIKSAGG